jgi:hypothetical protein
MSSVLSNIASAIFRHEPNNSPCGYDGPLARPMFVSLEKWGFMLIG